MDVRPGYKRTEVGVIPQDWEASKLGMHATFKTGPFGSALHQSDYVYDGVPVINPMQIVDGNIQPTPTMAITEQKARKLSEFRLIAGNVVIGRRGEMGRCAMVHTEQQGWLCGTGSMMIRTGRSLDARFIQRVLSSQPIITEIEQASVGSTMVNLNQGTLENLLIPLPPTKAEQEAIAEVLSDADALIESLEQLLTKKHQIKKGAMQELLTGKKRLPGFSGKWEIKQLGEISAIAMGRTPSRNNAEFWGRGHVWLSIADLRSKVVKESKETITDLAAADMSCVPKGTLLMSFKLSIGKLCFAGCDLFTNEAICSFTNVKAHTDYLYYALCRTDFSLYGKQAVKGYTLNSESLKVVEVLLPKLPEQTAIATILSDMDAEITALEAKLSKARLLKQGMMQELLTGRIRLL